MTSNDTIRAFVDCINAHDVRGLGELMAEDHTFVDAHGNEVRGREKMIAGWRGYFQWFPDYYIEVTDVFEDRAGSDNTTVSEDAQTLAMFGFAGGSFKAKETERWRLPAAWKAIVEDNRITLWQVFADTKIPFEIIQRNATGQ